MIKNDEFYMNEALELAKKGKGFTKTNPLVGAVLVKNDKIITKGYHKAFGKAHAEAEVIKKAGTKAKGASLYVNLEPCCTTGKTPPCTKAIIKAGIKEVIIGMKDPNPKVNGKGIKELENNGIKTKIGILEDQCKLLNKFFIHNQKTGLPFVAFKAAISADEKIGITGKRIKISCKEADEFTQELRREYDAILVGSDTVLTDNPLLTTRGIKPKKDPLRIIIDKENRIPKTAKVFKDKNYLHIIEKDYKLNKNGHFNLKKILKDLYKQNISSVLVEGGSKIFSSFIEQKIPQIAYYIVSSTILGEKNTIPLYKEETIKKFDFEIEKSIEKGVDTIYLGKFFFDE